jgi:preprotein translocase subunit SecF
MTQAQSPKGVINFMRFRWLFALISMAILIPGVISLIFFGLKLSIDFTGGTLLEISPKAGSQINSSLIETSAPEGIEISSVQTSNDDVYLIRSKPMTKDQADAYKYAIASASGMLTVATPAAFLNLDDYVQELRFETVGPTLGRELMQKTVAAIIIAALFIMGYVAYRFKEFKYGLSAILAMFHDSLIVLGVFSLLGRYYGVEVDTLFVTAILTTLSFSVHDTIVVFNRIKEKKARFITLNPATAINVAISETLARSINNSLTIIFMLLALILFGGDSIRWFVVALLVGTISGTYSSPFVAGPLLLLWDNWFKAKIKR